MSTATPTDGDASLRAEHDRLSLKLGARCSIDTVRRGSYAAFGLAICFGLSIKLAYDRWGPHPPRVFKGPPIFFYLAAAVALAFLAMAAVSFVRARRQMRLEDQDFARLCVLRDRLGLDP